MSNLTTPLRVPADLLVELGDFAGYFWSDFRLEPIICDAIRAYMKAAPTATEQATEQSDAGYQWKELFLPEGTRLRARFGREQYFAVVKQAEIICADCTVSPSRFANMYGSGNRNAWKAVWLRLPGNDGWLLADVCRAARKAAITRMLGGDTKRAP